MNLIAKMDAREAAGACINCGKPLSVHERTRYTMCLPCAMSIADTLSYEEMMDAMEEQDREESGYYG